MEKTTQEKYFFVAVVWLEKKVFKQNQKQIDKQVDYLFRLN